MNLNVFDYNERLGVVNLNSADLVLIDEFAKLLKRDRDRAFREFTYIYLAIDWKSPYSNYSELERHEAALNDAIDGDFESTYGIQRMDKEKFVESFLRRFAENASLSRTYQIDIYDINEEPPKVSIKVSSTEKGTSEIVSFDLVNKVDAILETVY